MRNVGRKLAFVIAATNHGSMIVNRFDHRMLDTDRGYGVGYQLLETGSCDAIEVELSTQLLELRRRYHGDGVLALDCGANIGVHAIEWATAMSGWGSVMAIEPQERVYYALAGNIALNNCFNAVAMHAAVAAESGVICGPDARLSDAVELRQSRAAAARQQRIHRPDHRLFGRKQRSRAEDRARCAGAAARRSDQARYRGHGTGGAGRRQADGRTLPADRAGRDRSRSRARICAPGCSSATTWSSMPAPICSPSTAATKP